MIKLKVKIFECTPILQEDMSLISAYNSFMDLMPDDAWVIFRDADTLFLDYAPFELIIKSIKENPDVSCFSCMTNRIGQPRQKHNTYSGDDITKHRDIANQLRNLYGTMLEDFSEITPISTISGMVMILSKKAWNQIGGFKEYRPGYGKILGVDTRLHMDLSESGLQTKLIKGLYVYHWYRGGTGDSSHLK